MTKRELDALRRKIALDTMAYERKHGPVRTLPTKTIRDIKQEFNASIVESRHAKHFLSHDTEDTTDS